MLLVDAIKRTMGASDILAIHAVIADAKNNAAKQVCEGFGLVPMQGNGMRLFYRPGDPPLGFPTCKVHFLTRSSAHSPNIPETSVSQLVGL